MQCKHNPQSQPGKDSTTTAANPKASLLIPVLSSTHSLALPKCTAVADVLAGPYCCSANILLDEGAQ